MKRKVHKIHVKDLAGLISHCDEADYVVIDARDNQKYEAGHYCDAVNIDPTMKNHNLQLINYLDKKAAFIYCGFGVRTRAIIDKLQDAGFKGELYDIAEDIEDWARSGFEI